MAVVNRDPPAGDQTYDKEPMLAPCKEDASLAGVAIADGTLFRGVSGSFPGCHRGTWRAIYRVALQLDEQLEAPIKCRSRRVVEAFVGSLGIAVGEKGCWVCTGVIPASGDLCDRVQWRASYSGRLTSRFEACIKKNIPLPEGERQRETLRMDHSSPVR